MTPPRLPSEGKGPGCRDAGALDAFRSLPAPANAGRRFLGALLLAALAPAVSEAGLIYWGSEGFVTHADSRDREWDAGFAMELGVFRDGFTPDTENHEAWLEHWVKIGVAGYDAEESRFAGVADTGVALPAGAGTQVYVWAKNGDDLTQGPEWFLGTHPEWKWPAAGAATAPAAIWTTDVSMTWIVGRVGRPGRHLTSEMMRPVPVSREAWLAKFFPEHPELAQADADPDGDGVCNTLEYFLGTDPREASSGGGAGLRQEGKGMRLRLARNAYAKSSFVLEKSADLRKWTRVEAVEVLTDRPDLLEVEVERDASAPSVFFRFQLQSDDR